MCYCESTLQYRILSYSPIDFTWGLFLGRLSVNFWVTIPFDYNSFRVSHTGSLMNHWSVHNWSATSQAWSRKEWNVLAVTFKSMLERSPGCEITQGTKRIILSLMCRMKYKICGKKRCSVSIKNVLVPSDSTLKCVCTETEIWINLWSLSPLTHTGFQKLTAFIIPQSDVFGYCKLQKSWIRTTVKFTDCMTSSTIYIFGTVLQKWKRIHSVWITVSWVWNKSPQSAFLGNQYSNIEWIDEMLKKYTC